MQKFLRTLTLMLLLAVPWVTQAQQTLPYSYGFEDNDLSADGWLLQNASSSYTGINGTAAQTGSYGFTFYYSEQNNATLVSPLLTGGNNGVIVSFYYKSYSSSYLESFQVGYTTDENVTDASLFTYPSDCSISDAPTTWTQFEHSFPAGTKRIAIKYIYTDAWYLYIDDIFLDAVATCPAPINLAVSEIGPNSAKLSWTERGTATTWKICVNGDENHLFTATTNPFTLTGLTAETAYNVKVRAYCSSTDQSTWSSDVSFTTTSACPVPYDVTASNVAAHGATLSWTGFSNSYNVRYRQQAGFFEDFENGLDNWTIYTEGEAPQANGWYVINPENGLNVTAHGGNYVASAWSWNSSAYNANNWLVTPQVTLGGTLSFWEYTNPSYPDSIEVILSLTGNTVADFQNGIVLRPMQLANSSWTEVVIDLSAYSGQGYIAIHHVQYDGNYLLIDDFAVTDPTANAWTTLTTTVTNSLLSGLTPAVSYEFQVQGVCGSTTTDWSELGTFTTTIACPIPTNFTYSNLTAHGFTLNWVAGGQETSWILTIGENTYTVTGDPTYTATGLQGETEYHVTLKADCGTTDGYSSEIGGYLTTDIACPAPTSLAAGSLTTSSAELSWTENGTATAWQLCINGDEDHLVAVTTNPYTLNGLTDNTTYTVKVRANCGSVDGVSQWSDEMSFTTVASCVAPTNVAVVDNSVNAHGATVSWESEGNSFIIMVGEEATAVNENFESGNIGGLFTNDATYPWVVVSSSEGNGHNGTYCVKSGNSGVASSASTLTLNVNLTEAGVLSFLGGIYGEGTSSVWDKCIFSIDGTQQFSLGALASWSTYTYNLTAGSHTLTWSYTKDGSVNPTGDAFFVDDIVISSGVSSWDNSRTANASPYTFTGLTPETSYLVKVVNVCGSSTSSPSEAVKFTTTIACPAPTELTAGIPNTNDVTLSWTANGTTSWQVCVNDDEDHLITANTNPFTLSGLTASTDYTVKVRANCGNADGMSQWSNVVSFTTQANCPAPILAADGITNVAAHTADVEWTGFDQNNNYVVSYRSQEYIDGLAEEFPTTAVPEGWTRYTGLVDQVLSGSATLATTTSGWVFNNANVFGQYHAKINIYGTSPKYWLVTPQIAVASGFGMSFDMALTDYNNANPIEDFTAQADDRFVVLISTDDGTTWTIIREWNNTGSAYVYNNIATTGETVTIDLSAYAGQNVKIAFYGESTATGGDNDLHIDNVTIGVTVPAGAWQTVNTSATSTSLTGLVAETPYEVKVKGLCSGNQESEESEVRTFTTTIACPATTNFAAGIPTPNSVELSWEENGTATAWQLCINGDEDHLVVANTNPFVLTGLTPSTDYTVKVRANCGGIDGQSSWSSIVSFTTQASCPAPILEADGVTDITAHTADLEWTGFTQNNNYVVSYRTKEYVNGIAEEFGTTIPTDWLNRGGLLSNVMSGTALTTTSQWSFGSNNGVFDNHARINIYGASRYGWLITPNMAVASGCGLSFDLALTAYSGTGAASGTCEDDRFVVLISTDDMTSWTILREWNNSGSEYVYNNIALAGENVTIDLAAYAGQNVRIAFYGESTVNGNGDNNLHIDNVAIGVTVPAGEWQTVNTTAVNTSLTGLLSETPYEVKVKGLCANNEESEESDVVVFTTLPSCMQVDGLAIDPAQTTSNSMTLTWTDTNNIGATYIIYKNGAVEASAVSGTSYTVTGLEPNTSYRFAVMSDCGSVDGMSSMTSAVSGRTACAPMSLPWTCSFEADEIESTTAATALPWCSYRYVSPEATSGTTYPYSYASNPNTGSRSLYYYGTTGTANPEVMTFILPAVDVASYPMNGNRVIFWAKMGAATNSKEVHIGTLTNPADINTYSEVSTVTVSGNTYTKYTVNLSGAAATAPYVAITVMRGTGNLYLDDLTLEEMPSCLEITNLTVASVTSNSISLNWEDNDNPTATYTIYNMDDNSVIASGVTGLNYTVNNLNANAVYTFGVKASCPLGDAAMVTVSGRTACAAMNLPWTCGFEAEELMTTSNSEATPALPWCSQRYVSAEATSGRQYPDSYNNTSSSHNSSRCLRFYGSTSSSYPEVSAWILPQVNVANYPMNGNRINFWARMSTATASKDLVIGTMSDPNDMNTFTELGSITISGNTYTEYTMLLTSANATDAYLALKVNKGTGHMYIDDFVLEPLPSCVEVTSLTASDITTNSVVLSWIDGGNNNATYTVKNGDDVLVSGLTTTTYTVNGLTPNTDYVFTVIANCAIDAAPVTVNVHTLCESATLPFTENFEENSPTVGCWNFVSNNAANDVGTTNGMGFVTINGRRMWRFSSYTSAEDYYQYGYSQLLNVENVTSQNLAYYVRYATYGSNDHLWFGYVDANDNVVWPADDDFVTTTGQSDFQEYRGVIPSNAKKIAIKYWGNYAYYAWIDSINVTAKSAFEPINLTAVDITSSNATLTWERDARNNNTERYTVMNGTEPVAVGINGTSYTVTLTANTNYNFNVVAVNQGQTSNAEGVNIRVNEYPTETGKMVKLNYNYNWGNTDNASVSFYYGIRSNRTAEAVETRTENSGYGLSFTNTTSSNWPVDGPVTVVFLNHNANPIDFSSETVTYICPVAMNRETVTETANGAYTWTTPEGRTYNYDNHYTADLAQNEDGDIVATYTDIVSNAGGCDSIINTLHLTLHPDFVINVTDQFCEGTTYTVGTGDEAQSFTASTQREVMLHTITGADSLIVLNLQMKPSPSAQINNRSNNTISDYCDGQDLVLNARSNMEGVTFLWDDESTNAVRTVNPHENNTYTLIAIDPTTGCQSIEPATLTVTTTPVPALTITATDEDLCFGQSATLTVTDANNIEATYRWSNNQTGSSITVTPNETTTYTVTATTTGESACVVTAEKTITVNALPVVEVSTDVAALCANSTLTLTATTVDGYSYQWNTGATTAVATVNPTTSGAYTVTVTDQNDCVNEFTTNNVTVYPVYEINAARSACQEMLPITWGTQTINAAGNFDQTFQTVNGCDSLVHLTFTIEAMPTENSYAEYCDGATFTFGGQQYTATSTLTEVSYIDNSNTCPVNMVQHLTIHPVKATTVPLTVCDSYTWNLTNEAYTQSGNYEATLATIHGCDSVVTLALTVNYQNTGIDVQSACDQFVWELNGLTYNESTNEPVVTIPAANEFGCDSVVTLNLTVNYKTLYEDFHQVCDATSYTWLDGENYSDDVDIADGIVFKTGEDENGCDSIAQLHLDMNVVLIGDTLNWIDTLVCDDYYIDVYNCDYTITREYISESGDYIRRTRNAATGRPEISRIHLTVSNSDHQTIIASECVPWTWVVNDEISHVITSDTVLSQELTTESGCNLVKVLRFTAKYPTDRFTPVTLCQNGSWTDGNEVVYNAADYEIGENEPVVWNTATNALGCALTDYVVFTINPIYSETTEPVYCESEFTNGQLAFVNNNNPDEYVMLNIAEEGLNEQVYTSNAIVYWHTAAGCDSIVNINFTVKPTLYEDVNVQNCYSYEWHGVTYNELGETEATFETVSAQYGCDSIATLHLTLSDTVYGEVHITECGEYEYNGVLYRESMTFREMSGQAVSGCDSVTYYIHTLKERVMEDRYVLTNMPYTWLNGVTYNQSVSNVYYDATQPGECDSILALNLTMIDETAAVCEDQAPYAIGAGVTVDYLYNEVLPFDINDAYTFTNLGYGTSGTIYWRSTYGAGTHDNATKLYGANVYVGNYLPEDGVYNMEVFVNGTSMASGTYDITSSGYHKLPLANPIPIVNSDVVVIKLSAYGNYPIFTARLNNPVNVCELSSDNAYWQTWSDGAWELYGLFNEEDGMAHDYTYHSGSDNYDTILHFVVNHSSNEEVVETVCDSYTWTAGNGQTYTESGNYVYNVNSGAANGCDSTATLVLTVNYHSGENTTVTACDSYEWNATGQTYNLTESGVYYDNSTNAAGCPNIDTLNLTINVNPGFEETVVACDSYDWNGQTLTATGDYSVEFADANGCVADSVLHLTVNNSTEGDLTVIRYAASTYYNGNYYADIREREGEDFNQPYTFDVIYENGNAAGCDSTEHVILYVTRGEVIDENYNQCGNFTWERNNHTYAWLSDAERQAHDNALYMDITDNEYIHNGENPMVIETNAMGVATHTYVLWLNMIEANYFTVDLGTIMLSQRTDTIVNPGDSLNARTIDFSEYLANKQSVPNFSDTIHHTSTYYCENIVTYTANLVYNYDIVAPVTVCDVTSWTDPVEDVHTIVIGQENEIDYVTADGWNHHVVVTVTERTTSEPQIVEVCDTYTWTAGNGETYNESTTANWNDDVNCTAETLQLTINVNAGTETTDAACDSYAWNAPDGQTYNYTEGGVKTVSFTDANGCVGTATLNLTINTNAGTTETETACDSYTWQYMDEPLTQSNTYTVNYTDNHGCVGVHTLNLTINQHQDAEFTDAACNSYIWVANNNTEYDASGDYTRDIVDANNCPATETLHLTIYTPEVFTREQVVFGNGITIDGQFYPAPENGVAEYTIVRDTIDEHGCATTVTINLYVSQYEYLYTNKVECGSYTWTVADNGNEHTYRFMSAAEAAANPNALYWDETANQAVTEMPSHYNGNMIYVLNLTLNVPVYTDLNYSVPMSQLVNGVFTAPDGRTVDCSAAITAAETMTVNEEYSMKAAFPTMFFTACDSIVRYNVNVIYNYFNDNPVTLCAATTWTDPANVEHNVVIGENTFTYTLNAGEATEEVHTVVVTVLERTILADSIATICFGDSYTWEYNNVTYNETTNITLTRDNVENCDQQTLNLTVRPSSSYTEAPVSQCATYTWTVNTYAFDEATSTWVAADAIENTYTEVGTRNETVNFVDENGCAAVATLPLTINPVYNNVTLEVAACDSYEWVVNTYNQTNGEYEDVTVGTYDVSEEYIYTAKTAAGCDSVIFMTLTITPSTDSTEEYWFGDGSYRYTGIHTTATGVMYTPGDYNVNETVTRTVEEGCDIRYAITLHVGNNYTHTDAVRACNSYTWERNGMTYTRLTDAEAAANPNALYKDETGAMVMYNPTFYVEIENDYDSVYLLDLTLDAIHEEDVVVNVPVSFGTMTFGDSTFNFALASHDEGRVFEGTSFESDVHFGGVQYCDSIVHLTVNVYNNYVDEGVADICFNQTEYTWEGNTIPVAGDPDALNEYYVYNVVDADSTVHFQKVIQHPIQYTTERRVECDSYDWNGFHFEESTSNATVTLVDQFGCDSTITLTLTINHNTSTGIIVQACDNYKWTLSNDEIVPTLYTESGVYTMDYTTAEGCPSTDTLYLTVNNSDVAEFEAEACGSYTWMNGDEIVGIYNESVVEEHIFTNVYGCDSTVTMNLTVYEMPAAVNDTPESDVCDLFEWHGLTWNGSEMVDTLFATITETSYNLTAYAYNENGCQIEHTISAIVVNSSNGRTEVTACDSYEWNGETYTESGVYEYIAPTTNACGNYTDSLFLTINYNSGHAFDTAICNRNLPVGGYEWNGETYSTTGDYYYSYTDANNCPSTDTLHLTIGNVRAFNRIYVENCGPYTWDLTGETFDEVGYTEASTIYENASATGCDSVIFLYLTINDQTVINETDVVCDNELPYTWHGMNLETTGEYSDRGELIASGLCDTLFNLNLTVNERTYSNIDIVECDSYEWNGETYTESGVYTYTTTNAAGCDNIDTLHLTINHNSGHAMAVAYCDSYEWYGENYNQSGVYYHQYEDVNGCASVDTLNLTIANSFGFVNYAVACDSYTWTAQNGEVVGTYYESGEYTYEYVTEDGCSGTENLILTVNYRTNATIDQVACDSYNWYGDEYTESGVYTKTITNVAGCDSAITLNLTVNNSTEGEESASACNYYTWYGSAYIESGDYNHTTTNAAGCDSVITLHLTINGNSAVSISAEACDSYEWNGGNYNQSGVYTYATTNQYGCDSVVTLTLTVNNSTSSSETASECDSYTWNGETYTESGEYTFTTTNAAGCDSVVTLILTINHGIFTAEYVTNCDSYVWNGVEYFASGVYTHENTTSVCGGMDTLYLTINNSTTGSETAEACNFYIWNGTAYNQTGEYTQTLEAANGCDSVVTLNLTINNQVESSFSAVACGSYEWNGSTYTTTGAYTQHFNSAAGCDSVVTLNLTINNVVENTISATACDSYTWNTETYTTTGIYTQTFTAANGCDSVVTLNLTINSNNGSSTALTVCDSYIWNGTTYTQSGNYTHVNTDASGCDGTDTLVLTVLETVTNSLSATSCGSYTWAGETYTTSGNYISTYTAANDCDSIVTLNLTINQSVASTLVATACDSYIWNGTVYSTSGIYSNTYTAANGCDSVVTLSLTVNNSSSSMVSAIACGSFTWMDGQTYTASTTTPTVTLVNAAGCDSVVTLNLTINQPVSADDFATACGSYTWDGTTYNVGGNYTHTYTAANGCDSVVTMHLTINQPVATSIIASACGSYEWDNASYIQSGDYTHTYTAANGCDSVVTLHLTINQATTGDDYATACGSYTWEGTEYTTSGNYTHTYTGANGCDSTVTMHLTINQPVPSIVNVTACGSYTWDNATTYTQSGDYTITLTAANGCDSVVTLHLTINQPVTSSFTAMACSSYTWEGTEYTTSGNYTHTYSAANGCDSVVTLHLTINQPVTSSVYATACDSYTWDGDIYAISGTFVHTYTAVNGCDSVVTLNLTVNNSVSVIDEVSECDGFIWIDNVNYTESTNTPTVTLHTVNGCDSVITLHLTINHSVEIYDSIEILENQLPYNYHGNTIDAEGDFMITGTTVNGCDSTVYLHVSVLPVEAIDVTADLESITVYPNPTRGQSTVTADDVETIEVFDMVGHMVAKFERTNRIDISNLAEGAYTLRITTPNGTAVRRLIKK